MITQIPVTINLFKVIVIMTFYILVAFVHWLFISYMRDESWKSIFWPIFLPIDIYVIKQELKEIEEMSKKNKVKK